jgi:hypothetical protein
LIICKCCNFFFSDNKDLEKIYADAKEKKAKDKEEKEKSGGGKRRKVEEKDDLNNEVKAVVAEAETGTEGTQFKLNTSLPAACFNMTVPFTGVIADAAIAEEVGGRKEVVDGEEDGTGDGEEEKEEPLREDDPDRDIVITEKGRRKYGVIPIPEKKGEK